MGSGYSFKHTSHRESSVTGSVGGQSDSQRAITDYLPRVSKEDAESYILPVLKEVGKVIYPPAAIPIEILYQLYKHGAAIKEASSAIVEGNYEKAAKAIVKEGIKDGVGMALSSQTSLAVAQTAKAGGEEVKNEIIDEGSKQLAGKITQSTIRGGFEAIQDKLVDKTVEALAAKIEDKRKDTGRKDEE